MICDKRTDMSLNVGHVYPVDANNLITGSYNGV